MASGLIAGESLTGVMMAGIVLFSNIFKSFTHSLFGVEQFAWVAGPAGAWASLVALGAIVWVLVKIPLDNAKPSAAWRAPPRRGGYDCRALVVKACL